MNLHIHCSFIQFAMFIYIKKIQKIYRDLYLIHCYSDSDDKSQPVRLRWYFCIYLPLVSENLESRILLCIYYYGSTMKLLRITYLYLSTTCLCFSFVVIFWGIEFRASHLWGKHSIMSVTGPQFLLLLICFSGIVLCFLWTSL
jgi:hypothetical protein